MNCPSCGCVNPDGNAFCGRCGAGLEAACPECGRKNPLDNRYCGSCGNQLDTAPATTRTQPSTYTPPHLVEKILSSRSALEGERKQVTVLFADVKHSMALAEQLDPEEWHQILDRFFAILGDGIHRFEGTINQYTGDGVMALFGAPIAHEDHAQRACYAALHFRERLRSYADTLRIERGIDFRVRTGLNSGEVIVGKIGDDLRMDYTAQGHTVGLAQRVEQLAATGSVYVSEHTQRLVEGYFEFRPLGNTEIEGSDASIAVFELEGATDSRTRLDVSRERGLTRFVGRHDELDLLEAALNRAARGHGQVVGVVGDPGLGKSRLCLEFTERCKQKGIPVYSAHCPAHGKNIPLIPILELFRDYFGIEANDEPVRARQKIAGVLVLLDSTLNDSLPLLFDFMGVADPSAPLVQLEPEVRQKLLFTLIRRVYSAQSSSGHPSVVLVDDLHWIDPGSDEFVAQLVAATENNRSMLLLNFRPEYKAAWSHKSHYQQLPLVPLGPAEARELVDDLLGRDPTVTALAARIVTWTAGNPFFTEEVIQTLIELGHVQGTAGAYRLVTRAEELDVPANVQALLAARIDRLPDDAKHLLQTASVIGKNFSGTLLATVSDLTDPDSDAAIARLKESEFIHETALYPVAEYAFKHPLTHEVAYQSQLHARQKQIHAQVARAVAVSEAAKLDEHAALIAHHWEQAEEALDAARWYRRAAEWTGTTDVAGSSRQWEHVRGLLGSTPSTSETDALGVAACRGLLNLGWRLGHSAEFEAVFADGRLLAERSGDRRSLAILHNLYGNVLGAAGDVAAYKRFAAEAARMAAELGDVGAQRGLDADLATASWWAGEFDEALELITRWLGAGVETTAGNDVLGVSVQMQLLWVHSQIMAEQGRLEEARSSIELSDAAGKAHGNPEMDCWAVVWRSPIEFRSGDVPRALATAQQGLQKALSIGTPVLVTWANIFSGMAHLANREWDKAVAFQKEALSVSGRGRVAFGYSAWAHTWMAEAMLGKRDISAARDACDAGLATARRSGSSLFLMDVLLTNARVLIREGVERAEIEQAVADASSLVERTGGRCRRGVIDELQAELESACGNTSAAADHLSDALNHYRETGAHGHAERLMQASI